jgi:hypothetical protein
VEKIRKLINDNLINYPEFEYYLSLVDKVEENIELMPDISIETCKSLIEGISKKVLNRLKIDYKEKGKNADSVNLLLRKVFENLSKYVEVDTDFSYSACSLACRLSDIRNERGDISHGKVAPKKYLSDSNLSEVSAYITDGILCYILKIYFDHDWSDFDETTYETNEEFNSYLDEENPIEGISYSKALFDQDPIAYDVKLSDYLADDGSDK